MAQVWAGLVMKAENAVPFVPAMQSCVVIERYRDGLLREVVNRGHTFRERITFTPPVEVYFERVDTPDNAGWITNVVSESDNGLILSFTFAVRFPGVVPDSEDERKHGIAMQGSYGQAVQTTLDTVRRLVTAGKL